MGNMMMMMMSISVAGLARRWCICIHVANHITVVRHLQHSTACKRCE
jgi:hypothetical protein